MTKAELLAAIAAAPEDASVYIDTQNGLLRTLTVAIIEAEEEVSGKAVVILSFDSEEEEP